jgi:hypothetical protein
MSSGSRKAAEEKVATDKTKTKTLGPAERAARFVSPAPVPVVPAVVGGSLAAAIAKAAAKVAAKALEGKGRKAGK